MLTEKEIESKLFDQAGIFEGHMKRKEYAQAKYCYDRARDVALFVQMDADKRRRLFGDTQEEPPVEGMFREGDVQEAYFQCAVMNDEREQEIWEEIQRREGQTALDEFQGAPPGRAAGKKPA